MFGSFQILIGQSRVEKTFILQRTIFQRNLLSYIDSIAPVFLALHGVPNDTVSVTFNYNKSSRIYILNEDGFDTVVISRGNHVMSLIYDVYSDLPLSIGDTAIFNNSITVSSKYEIKLKSFSKGVNQLNYLDTGQNWPIDSDKIGSYTYPNTIQIDGSAVTPKVPAAISAGNASSIDAYSFTIIKTASATFTVLETQTKFA